MVRFSTDSSMNWAITDSGNNLSPDRHVYQGQVLVKGPLGTYFINILITIWNILSILGRVNINRATKPLTWSDDYLPSRRTYWISNMFGIWHSFLARHSALRVRWQTAKYLFFTNFPLAWPFGDGCCCANVSYLSYVRRHSPINSLYP